jgi:acid phosphatase type 7
MTTYFCAARALLPGLFFVGSLTVACAQADAPKIIRGPYLQAAGSNTMTVRWRTDQPTNSQVAYGTSATKLSQTSGDPQPVTEHIVTLTGLKPATRYAYAVGSASGSLQTDPDQYFRTNPVPGATGPHRIWVLGDFGSGTPNQVQVRDAALKATADHRPDAWIMLGDNTYSTGTDKEYQDKFFDKYQTEFFKNTPFLPCPGNHDYGGQITNQNIPYFTNFTMPTHGEAGGVASESASYYSTDYGNVHIVSLDSYGKLADGKRMYEPDGKQVDWLKRDLAANKQPWTVVFWHHPPFSKASHDSDTEKLLVDIRQGLLPVLEQYKVDMVFCGHSHGYERSQPMRGHYGLAETFSTQHVISGATAEKPNEFRVGKDGQGVIYIVAGSGGQLGGQSPGFPHKSMVFSDVTHGGSVLLDVEKNRLNARWICADGVVRDEFSIIK